MPLLLSSDADLFLRQRDTLITRRKGAGPLTVEGEGAKCHAP